MLCILKVSWNLVENFLIILKKKQQQQKKKICFSKHLFYSYCTPYVYVYVYLLVCVKIIFINRKKNVKFTEQYQLFSVQSIKEPFSSFSACFWIFYELLNDYLLDDGHEVFFFLKSKIKQYCINFFWLFKCNRPKAIILSTLNIGLVPQF